MPQPLMLVLVNRIGQQYVIHGDLERLDLTDPTQRNSLVNDVVNMIEVIQESE